jgi:hypothetical protein
MLRKAALRLIMLSKNGTSTFFYQNGQNLSLMGEIMTNKIKPKKAIKPKKNQLNQKNGQDCFAFFYLGFANLVYLDF